MTQAVITELVIDARAAEVGASAYARAMDRARSSVEQLAFRRYEGSGRR